MAGWTILDRLKHDPATRHIPVHVISGDENRRRGLALGAMTYLEKSITKDNLSAAFDTIHHSLQRRTKKLLIVAGEEARQAEWRELLGGSDVEILAVRHRRRSLGGGESSNTWMASCSIWSLAGYSGGPVGGRDPGAMRACTRRPSCFAALLPGARRFEAEIRRLARSGVVRYAESAGTPAGRNRAPPAPRGSRIFPSRSGRCWRLCGGTTPRWPARRCWWWTTTSAISSRSPACWSSTTCRWFTPRMAARESRCC